MAAADSVDERHRIAQMDSCTICRGEGATACAAASEGGDGESAAAAAAAGSAASAGSAAGSCEGEGVDASPRGDAAPARCMQCIEHGLAFNASYTIPAVASAMIRCFTARGLRRSLVRDNSCVVQWAPFTKIAWPRVLNGEAGGPCLCSSRDTDTGDALVVIVRAGACAVCRLPARVLLLHPCGLGKQATAVQSTAYSTTQATAAARTSYVGLTVAKLCARC